MQPQVASSWKNLQIFVVSFERRTRVNGINWTQTWIVRIESFASTICEHISSIWEHRMQWVNKATCCHTSSLQCSVVSKNTHIRCNSNMIYDKQSKRWFHVKLCVPKQKREKKKVCSFELTFSFRLTDWYVLKAAQKSLITTKFTLLFGCVYVMLTRESSMFSSSDFNNLDSTCYAATSDGHKTDPHLYSTSTPQNLMLTLDDQHRLPPMIRNESVIVGPGALPARASRTGLICKYLFVWTALLLQWTTFLPHPVSNVARITGVLGVWSLSDSKVIA